MNLFYYISFLAGTTMVPVSTSIFDPQKLFDDYLMESREVCAAEGSMKTAIATCKLDNLNLSFEDKVRICTIKMRPAVGPLFLK
jgi:hypothetical protein